MPTQDISRSIFDPRKHYTGVRMQQGKVLVDDDWNEDRSIESDDERRARVHIIGPAGSPDTGFKIAPLAAAIAATDPVDFTILPGTFYLGGLRLELSAAETLRMQTDWIRVSASLPARPTAQRDDLVYLEAYEQPVTAAEDSELLECALGGPDTSTRTRVVRRVRVVPGVASTECAVAWQAAVAAWTAAGDGAVGADCELVSDARLATTFVPGAAAANLCAPTLSGGYLGAENQAIRVELLGSTALTWSFDNAAPVYRVTMSNGGATVTMVTPPRDELHWPVVDQVVEIIPCGGLLPNGERVAERQGQLAKVTRSYDPDSKTFDIAAALPNVVTASVQPPVSAGPWAFGEEWRSRTDGAALAAAGSHAYLRVWNRGTPTAAAAPVPFVVGTAVTLGNTGIAVTITGTSLRAGDHWIIAARPQTPAQVVPWELELATGRLATGVRRWRAPLGIIRWTPAGNGTLTAELMHDCRLPFRPLTRQQGCCRYRVGDELHSYGDFSSIQAAIAALPPGEGGEICVLPGEYRECVDITDLFGVEIHGCGVETVVIPPVGGTTAAFTILDSQDITIRDLAIQVTDVEGVRVEQTHPEKPGVTMRVRLEGLAIEGRDKSAIFVDSGTKDVTILRNDVKIVELAAPLTDTSDAGQWAAITCGAYKVRIEENSIVVEQPSMPYTAFGGIQLLGLSEEVEIRRNIVLRGNGNGITLGSTVMVDAGSTTPTGGADAPGGTIVVEGSGCVHVGIVETGDNPTKVPMSAGPLGDIRILDNRISEMGANGIGVIQFFDLSGDNAQFITVDRLLIEDNRIRHCLQLEPLEPPITLWADVGYGGIALADGEHIVIRRNLIERNGRNHKDAVCGIFVLRAAGLVIDENHVLENGPITSESIGSMTLFGHRGGIVVFRVLPGSQLVHAKDAEAEPEASALATLRVHDNEVVHPMGRALFVMGLGQMSIQGNQFTSRGANFANFLQILLQALQVLFGGGLSAAEGKALLTLLLLELVSGRTVTVINTGMSPELLMAIEVKKMLNLDKSWSAAPVGKSAFAPFVADPNGKLGDQLELLVRAGGNVLFTDNQVRFDLEVPQQILALTSVVLLSLDEITSHDNQLDCLTTESDFIVANLAAAGWSMSAQGSRMKETPLHALLSAATTAFMNNTSGNQGTHCFFIKGLKKLRISHSNRSLLGTLWPQFCEWIPKIDATDDKVLVGVPIGVTPPPPTP